MAPWASKALGLSSPMPAVAGVLVAEAMPVEDLEPVLELPWEDMVVVLMFKIVRKEECFLIEELGY